MTGYLNEMVKLIKHVVLNANQSKSKENRLLLVCYLHDDLGHGASHEGSEGLDEEDEA